MKSKKNKTFDYLSTKLLKKCDAQLSPVIAEMVNKSFSEAQVPTLLKRSRVVPVYKSGP